MKLLSIHLARSVWLFPVIFINPKGINVNSAIPLLAGLYKFKKTPSQSEVHDITKEGMKFDGGEFINKEGKSVNINFVVHGDGLIADTRSSTKDTDDFLDEILKKLSEEFSLPDYTQITIRKLYVSQIYFNTDKHLETLNPKLKKFSGYLSNYFKHPYELGSLSFWADQISPFNPQQFTFERVVAKPFSENMYYSASGLQTEDHLNLLNKLENILGS